MMTPTVISTLGTVTKGLIQGLGVLEISGRLEIIQITFFYIDQNTVKILEAWGDLLSLKLKCETICKRWWEKLSKENNTYLVKEIIKIWHLKTTTLTVIVWSLGMTKKETDKHLRIYLVALADLDNKCLLFAERSISLGEHRQFDWKGNTRKRCRKKAYIHTYIHRMRIIRPILTVDMCKDLENECQKLKVNPYIKWLKQL